jgi:RNA polymerase sigma-70 factor (ECF subfamily)
MQSSPADEIDKRDVTAACSAYPGTEEELVAAAKTGDEAAFETLVKRHKKRIFALAVRYTRIPEDAEDIVQQTLQKAFVYLQKFEGKSSFSTWLTRITINEALMLLRKRRALREEFIDATNSGDQAMLGFDMPDAGPDPEVTYLQREGARVLSAAIAQLRPSLRVVIELQELGELTARETAGRMGLSVSAVKARVFHGRRKLREALRHHMRSSRRFETNILIRDPNAKSQS